ncbi:MAG TPA: ABC transporter substrate-binding protein [Bacillota bacterium]|nr:ABC transporter substrate-binding protein [Bacillota bacterium]HOA15104.1 ABC transporter substrate-binding protein [Bacillota bacterium]HOG52318.1 ABC transporter substrate-binding protein [Bacillota bacterium]
MRKGWAILALLFIVVLQATGMEGCKAAPKPKVVALNGVTGLGLALLFESGDYEIEVGKSADVAVARLTSDGAEIAALPVSTAALLRNKGVPIRIAAVTNYGSLYVVSRAEGGLLQSASSYLGVPGKGTMPDVTLAILLAEYKSASSGVQHHSSPVELANLLLAGKAQAALLPEPWVSQVLAKDAGLRITSDIQAEWRAKFGFDYPLSCVVVTEKFADERPDALKKLLSDIEKSVDWVKSNPGKAAAMAAEKLSMDPAATEKAVPRCNFAYLDGPAAKAASSQFYSKVLQYAPTMIGGKLPDEAFYLDN